MKRLFFKSLVLVPLLLASLTSNAQEEKTVADKIVDKMVFDIGLGAVTKSHDMKPYSLYLNAGYKFTPRIYAFANIEGLIIHHDENDKGVGNYMKGNALGLGLGYSFWKSSKIDNESLDIYGIVGTSVGGQSFYKYTKYDVQLLYRFSETFIGVGFRHMNSRTIGVKDHNGLYVTIGLCL